MVDYELAGRVALVTGGASGIGAACARTLARSGARVVIADLNADAAASMATEIGGGAISARVDVADPSSVEAMVGDAVSRMGTLDIAVNNAGIGGESAPVADYTPEGWRMVLGVNLDGVFYCTRAELRVMRKGASIVNMSSILGSVGFPGSAAYVAAKHGVVGLTQNAALENAEAGIRVNAVGPAFVHTPLIESSANARTTEAALVGRHPIGRLGAPEEVAELVAWLASDASSFATGGYYPVDGGYLAQ